MEKPPTTKSKNHSNINILKFLPKAAQLAAVSFQNYPPFSPGRDNKRADAVSNNRPKTHLCKGFSGPFLPMIPAEARTKSKSFETTEPTSPKISCMGQIKHRKMIKKQASMPRGFKPTSFSRPEVTAKPMLTSGPTPDTKAKKQSAIKKILARGRKSDASSDKPPLPDRAPSLSQMRRFASSRDTLSSFDWTAAAQVAPDDRERGFYSDDDGGYSDVEDDVGIPFSTPMMLARVGSVGGSCLEPRKEINLWKRRTMSQPKPLNLNVVRAQ